MSALSPVAKAILRNPGTRSSATGLTVTVFGCTGFLGRYVCSELGRMGIRLVVPYRGDEMEIRHLKVMGDLGNVAPIPFHARDRESIRYAVEGSDMVLNLIGKHYETKHLFPWWINNTFDDTHVLAAKNIAEVCTEANIPRLLHVSSLIAKPNSPSVWAASKYRGELAVRKAFPSATIVRPGLMFGPEDRSLSWIAQRLSRPGVVPLISGEETVVSPVFAGDVARAIRALVVDETIEGRLEDDDLHGREFEFVGDDTYTRKELVEFVASALHKKPSMIHVPQPIMETLGKAIQQFPNPIFTQDDAIQMSMNQIKTSNLPGFKELEIEPVNMEKEAMNYLIQYDQGGHFNTISGYH